MKKMNLPNKLTVTRIALVPVIVAVMLIDFPLHYLAAGLLFGAASITDALDGKIARRDNLITDFGKFADPLADKILVISVLICFVKCGLCGAVPLIIVIIREFAVTSVRLVAAANGKVIAANMWGKVKTVTQIVAIIAIYVFQVAYELFVMFGADDGILVPLNNILFIAGHVLIWISVVFTMISGAKYLLDNKEVISDM